MIRVPTSRGQKWLDELPLVDPENPVEGFGIFTGIVNDVENLVFKIHLEEGTWYLSAAYEILSNGYLAYDPESDTIVSTTFAGTDWAQSIISQAGLGGIFSPSAGSQVTGLTKGQILYKAVPV